MLILATDSIFDFSVLTPTLTTIGVGILLAWWQSKLSKRDHRDDTRFKVMHEKRALEVEVLYRSMLATRDAVQAHMLPKVEGSDVTTQSTNAWDAMRDFRKCLEERRIYLPIELADRLSASDKEIFNLWIKYTEHFEQPQTFIEHWEKAWNDIEKKMQPIISVLEQEFRRLIGADEK